MATNSFADDAQRISEAVSFHASEGRVVGRSLRKRQCMDAIFSTRCVSDSALRNTLFTQLIPMALSAATSHGPVWAEFLRRLISTVEMAESRDAAAASGGVPILMQALYVILKTSLISQNRDVHVPRLYASPLCIRVVEAVTSSANQQRWVADVDPVITTITPSARAAKISSWNQSASRDSGLVLSKVPSCGVQSGKATRRHWDDDLVIAEDAILAEEASRQRTQEILDRFNVVKRIQNHDGEQTAFQQRDDMQLDSAAISHSFKNFVASLPQHCYVFKLLRARPPVSTSNHRGYGAILVAAYYALTGSPDPYGLVWRNRKKCMAGNRIPVLELHPSVMVMCPISARPPPTSRSSATVNDLMQQQPKPARGILGVLIEAVRYGNILVVCQELASAGRSATKEQRVALGSVGIAALESLATSLMNVICIVADWLTEVAVRVQAVQLLETLHHFHHRITPIGACIEQLAHLFGIVDIQEPTFSLANCLNQCNASLLSTLYEAIEVQSPAQNCSTDGETHSLTCALVLAEIPRRLLMDALRPWCQLCRRWILEGDLLSNDVYDEFFIVPSYGSTACGYQIMNDRLPVFIDTQTAERILHAGCARYAASSILNVLLQSKAQHDAATEPQQQPAVEELHYDVLGRDEMNTLQTAHQRLSGAVSPAFAIPDVCVDDSLEGALSSWHDYLSFLGEPINLINELGRMKVSQRPDSEEEDYVSPDTGSVDSTTSSSTPDDDARSPPGEEGSEMDKESPTLQIPSTTASSLERWEDSEEKQLKELKEKAAQQLRDMYGRKMKALEHQEKMLRWRARRIGLKFRRNAVIRSEVEDIKHTYETLGIGSSVVGGDRVTRAGSFVVPLQTLHVPSADGMQLLVESHPDVMDTFGYPLQVEHEAADNTEPPVPSPPTTFEPHYEHEKNDECGEDRSLDVPSTFIDGAPVISEASQMQSEYETVMSESQNIDTAAQTAECNVGSMFAPMPLDDEEHAEIAGVGVTRNHFIKAREQVAVDVFQAREKFLEELSSRDVLDEAYVAVCAQAASSPEFLGDSQSWSPLRMATHTDFVLEDAHISSEADNPLLIIKTASSSSSSQPHVINDGRNKVPTVNKYFSELSRLVSSFFVRKTLQLVLAPRRGVAARILSALRSVCLLQHGPIGSAMMSEMEAAAFDTVPFSARDVVDTMRHAFDRAWHAVCGPVLSEAFPLCLVVDASDVLPNAPFELLPKIRLALVPSPNTAELETALWYVFPEQYIRRYSDLFVSLLFWRWVQRLLTVSWRTGITSTRIPEVWLFISIARSVVNAVATFVWYEVSQCCLKFDRWLADIISTETVVSLESLSVEHNEFLAVTFHSALLIPTFSRSRKQLRSMVRLIEEVYAYLVVHSTKTGRSVTERQDMLHVHQTVLRKRIRDFTISSELFVKHLNEAVIATPQLGGAHYCSSTNSGTRALESLIEHLTSIVVRNESLQQ